MKTIIIIKYSVLSTFAFLPNPIYEGGYVMAIIGRPRIDDPKDKRVSMRVMVEDKRFYIIL